MATINGSYQKVQNLSGELDTLHLSSIQALPGRTVVDPLTGNVTPANPKGFLGFFGATPVGQQVATTTTVPADLNAAASAASFNTLILALTTLGLIRATA